jgi:ABC-2 type transport system ATP-binding protein
LNPTNGPGNGSDDRAYRFEVRDLAVRRGDRQVLAGLTFGVGRGEAFGLLGPNGAGKTTAFHVITGLLPPDSGVVALDGVEMAAGDRRLRRECGVVFQQPALDPRLGSRMNLLLAARLYGVPSSEARRRVDAALDEAGFADRANDPVKTFSGGMRRRVEIARALLHEPSILILDEPTTGLDERAYRATWETLDRLRRDRGLTLVVTTHRPDEAERCDRLAILDGGRVVACDRPDALRSTVRGDLIVIETDDPESAAAALRGTLGEDVRVLDGRVVLERESAHAWVPRIVEALPDGTIRAISVRTAGLGEVFLELTGHELADDAEVPR